MDSSSHKKMSSAGPTIVVLGAGINGAALARQFVLNNANVIIADTRDIAGGTTAWSPRLISQLSTSSNGIVVLDRQIDPTQHVTLTCQGEDLLLSLIHI